VKAHSDMACQPSPPIHY